MSKKRSATASALDLNRIAALLPSKAAEAKQREEYTELFSTAARAGAGGTKAGLPGLRPLGKRGMDFIDTLTPKRKKKKNWREDILPEDGAHQKPRDIDVTVKIILPRSFCPDCGRNNRPKVGGVVNVNSWPKGRPEWRMGPKDLMLSFFCDECFQKNTAGKHDKADDIYLAQAGINPATRKGDLDAAERLVRIKTNTEAFVRERMTMGDESIFNHR